jgi:hypothetical protein
LLNGRSIIEYIKVFKTENEEPNSGGIRLVLELPKALGSLGKNSRMALVASQNFIDSGPSKAGIQSGVPRGHLAVLGLIIQRVSSSGEVDGLCGGP